MEVTGKVHKILPLETGESKAGKEFVKQLFVIDTEAKFNPLVAIQAFGDDKCDLVLKLSVGQKITAHINVSSREWKDKWFTQVDLWKIDILEEAKTQPMKPNAEEFNKESEGESLDEIF